MLHPISHLYSSWKHLRLHLKHHLEHPMQSLIIAVPGSLGFSISGSLLHSASKISFVAFFSKYLPFNTSADAGECAICSEHLSKLVQVSDNPDISYLSTYITYNHIYELHLFFISSYLVRLWSSDFYRQRSGEFVESCGRISFEKHIAC